MGIRAGFWIRVLAAMIDGIAMLAFGVASGVVFEAVWEVNFDVEQAEAVASASFFAAWLLYTSTEIWFAATPGKLATQLRIMRIDGSPADWWRLFLRWQTKHYPSICWLLFAATALRGFYVLAGFMNGIVVIGCLFAMNDNRLAWHDEWAYTAVCWKQRKRVAVMTPPPLPAA